MTRMNGSHAGVPGPSPEVDSALDVLLHVLIPAVGYALLFLLHVFALLLGMFFSYPLWVRSFVIHHIVLDLRLLCLVVDNPLSLSSGSSICSTSPSLLA